MSISFGIGTFIDKIQSGASLPVMIGVVLAIAFIAMLAVTIWTIISIKRAESKAKKSINLPPSAMQKDEKKDRNNNDDNANMPPSFGEAINSFLIKKGYISVHNVVRSFFRAIEFLKDSLGNGYKYKLPWFMIVGTSESGKSSLLSGFTHDEVFDDENEDADCTWWFLKGGVVLDIKGEAFLPNKSIKTNEKSWTMILNMLARYRSAKPLNGIILTIPANEIYGKNKLKIEEIKSRAQYISRKLSFAQNYLGLKLPVYVIVTKTDLIPGFQSFCSEIPVRNRSNMLGWTCPYSLNSMYSPRWMDEAFDSIEDELNEIRMEIFSESRLTTTRDGIFVFPSELLTIKESISLYIDTIFKTGSSEERFYYRGLYFTGDSKMVPLLQFSGSGNDKDMAIMGTPDADVNEAGSLTASFRNEEFAPKKIFFFEDILLKKVFIEDGIASPMKTKIHQSNKAIFISKMSTAAFVIIGSYGLFSARDQLRDSKDKLYPSLFKVSSIIKDAENLTMKNLELSGNDILSECTTQLLAMMQQLNSARFSSLFVPASWFSSINSELTETLRSSYQRVVVRTIYMNLILKSRNLLNLKPTKENISTNIGEVLNPYKSKEYELMKTYVDNLIELDSNIRKFDSLKTSGDPRDLVDLIEYTFKGTLPKEFIDNYSQFRKILMNTPFPSIDLSPYKKVAYDVLINLYQHFINAIFTNRNEGSIISFLNRFVENLNKQNIKTVPDCKSVRKFSSDLTAVCKELGEEGKTWIDNDVFVAEKEYDVFLDNVETLFGKDVAQQLLDITAINFGYLKARLTEFNASLENDIQSKKLNQKTDEKQKPLTHGIFVMEKALASICKEPYMQDPSDYQLVTEIPEGKMIYWDDELVNYAYEMGKSFEQFFATNVKEFPRSMQEGITLLARANLCAVVASTVARAQSFVDSPDAITDQLTSEEILQKQVGELKDVGPKFVSLLKIMRDSNVNFVFTDLRTILNRIGFSLLSHIDKLLDNQKPYMPQNLSFSYWDGELGAGRQAYSAEDNSEMNFYITLQRQHISRLAIGFAEPIVQFLNSEFVFDQNFGNHGQLTKWTRIVDEVNGFKTKDPANSVSAVEKFISKTLNTYNLDNITTEINLNEIKGGESGDYFTNIIKQIKKGIMSRAEILLRQRNIKRYNMLREYYTKHLVNKYPFTNYDKSQRVSVDADLDSVKEFFKMYDEFGGSPEKILDQIYQLKNESKEQYEFLKKLHDLRIFLGDFVNTQYDTPKVCLEIDFNINKREETNTKYLVDRIFKPNNDANIEFISEDKSAIWYFGEPIRMILRWAEGNDNADRPNYDPNDPDVIIEDTTAKIECTGNWAALRFLQKYKTDVSNASKILQNQNVLLFKTPLSNGKVSKVYAAVTATLPKQPGDASVTTLKLPKTTEIMPEMSQKIISYSHQPILTEKNSGSPLVENDSNEDDEIISEEDVKQKDTKKSTEKKKAMEILESIDPAVIDDEKDKIIDISEEEIG